MNSHTKFLIKNILLIVLFAPLFCDSQKTAFGIKLGIALSNATVKNVNEGAALQTSSKGGILAGVYVDIPAEKKLILRPEIELVAKGAIIDKNGFSDPYSLRYTYVDFPVKILYKTSFFKGYLLTGGGPSIGIPLKNFYGGYPIKKEFGISLLSSYEFPIGFSLNLNYSYGLSNASKNKEYIKKISNRYFGITAGYTF